MAIRYCFTTTHREIEIPKTLFIGHPNGFSNLSIYWTSLLHIVILICFAIGAGSDILMILHRIAFGKMLSILVNNGSFLGHLTLHSNAKSASDWGKGNQTVMSGQAQQLWGMYQWAESILTPPIMHHDYLCNWSRFNVTGTGIAPRRSHSLHENALN